MAEETKEEGGTGSDVDTGASTIGVPVKQWLGGSQETYAALLQCYGVASRTAVLHAELVLQSHPTQRVRALFDAPLGVVWGQEEAGRTWNCLPLQLPMDREAFRRAHAAGVATQTGSIPATQWTRARRAVEDVARRFAYFALSARGLAEAMCSKAARGTADYVLCVAGLFAGAQRWNTCAQWLGSLESGEPQQPLCWPTVDDMLGLQLVLHRAQAYHAPLATQRQWQQALFSGAGEGATELDLALWAVAYCVRAWRPLLPDLSQAFQQPCPSTPRAHIERMLELVVLGGAEEGWRTEFLMACCRGMDAPPNRALAEHLARCARREGEESARLVFEEEEGGAAGRGEQIFPKTYCVEEGEGVQGVLCHEAWKYVPEYVRQKSRNGSKAKLLWACIMEDWARRAWRGSRPTPEMVEACLRGRAAALEGVVLRRVVGETGSVAVIGEEDWNTLDCCGAAGGVVWKAAYVVFPRTEEEGCWCVGLGAAPRYLQADGLFTARRGVEAEAGVEAEMQHEAAVAPALHWRPAGQPQRLTLCLWVQVGQCDGCTTLVMPVLLRVDPGQPYAEWDILGIGDRMRARLQVSPDSEPSHKLPVQLLLRPPQEQGRGQGPWRSGWHGGLGCVGAGTAAELLPKDMLGLRVQAQALCRLYAHTRQAGHPAQWMHAWTNQTNTTMAVSSRRPELGGSPPQRSGSRLRVVEGCAALALFGWDRARASGGVGGSDGGPWRRQRGEMEETAPAFAGGCACCVCADRAAPTPIPTFWGSIVWTDDGSVADMVEDGALHQQLVQLQAAERRMRAREHGARMRKHGMEEHLDTNGRVAELQVETEPWGGAEAQAVGLDASCDCTETARMALRGVALDHWSAQFLVEEHHGVEESCCVVQQHGALVEEWNVLQREGPLVSLLPEAEEAENENQEGGEALLLLHLEGSAFFGGTPQFVLPAAPAAQPCLGVLPQALRRVPQWAARQCALDLQVAGRGGMDTVVVCWQWVATLFEASARDGDRAGLLETLTQEEEGQWAAVQALLRCVQALPADSRRGYQTACWHHRRLLAQGGALWQWGAPPPAAPPTAGAPPGDADLAAGLDWALEQELSGEELSETFRQSQCHAARCWAAREQMVEPAGVLACLDLEELGALCEDIFLEASDSPATKAAWFGRLFWEGDARTFAGDPFEAGGLPGAGQPATLASITESFELCKGQGRRPGTLSAGALADVGLGAAVGGEETTEQLPQCPPECWSVGTDLHRKITGALEVPGVQVVQWLEHSTAHHKLRYHTLLFFKAFNVTSEGQAAWKRAWASVQAFFAHDLKPLLSAYRWTNRAPGRAVQDGWLKIVDTQDVFSAGSPVCTQARVQPKPDGLAYTPWIVAAHPAALTAVALQKPLDRPQEQLEDPLRRSTAVQALRAWWCTQRAMLAATCGLAENTRLSQADCVRQVAALLRASPDHRLPVSGTTNAFVEALLQELQGPEPGEALTPLHLRGQYLVCRVLTNERFERLVAEAQFEEPLAVLERCIRALAQQGRQELAHYLLVWAWWPLTWSLNRVCASEEVLWTRNALREWVGTLLFDGMQVAIQPKVSLAVDRRPWLRAVGRGAWRALNKARCDGVLPALAGGEEDMGDTEGVEVQQCLMVDADCMQAAPRLSMDCLEDLHAFRRWLRLPPGTHCNASGTWLLTVPTGAEREKVLCECVWLPGTKGWGETAPPCWEETEAGAREGVWAVLGVDLTWTVYSCSVDEKQAEGAAQPPNETIHTARGTVRQATACVAGQEAPAVVLLQDDWEALSALPLHVQQMLTWPRLPQLMQEAGGRRLWAPLTSRSCMRLEGLCQGPTAEELPLLQLLRSRVLCHDSVVYQVLWRDSVAWYAPVPGILWCCGQRSGKWVAVGVHADTGCVALWRWEDAEGRAACRAATYSGVCAPHEDEYEGEDEDEGGGEWWGEDEEEEEEAEESKGVDTEVDTEVVVEGGEEEEEEDEGKDGAAGEEVVNFVPFVDCEASTVQTAESGSDGEVSEGSALPLPLVEEAVREVQQAQTAPAPPAFLWETGLTHEVLQQQGECTHQACLLDRTVVGTTPSPGWVLDALFPVGVPCKGPEGTAADICRSFLRELPVNILRGGVLGTRETPLVLPDILAMKTARWQERPLRWARTWTNRVSVPHCLTCEPPSTVLWRLACNSRLTASAGTQRRWPLSLDDRLTGLYRSRMAHSAAACVTLQQLADCMVHTLASGLRVTWAGSQQTDSAARTEEDLCKQYTAALALRTWAGPLRRLYHGSHAFRVNLQTMLRLQYVFASAGCDRRTRKTPRQARAVCVERWEDAAVGHLPVLAAEWRRRRWYLLGGMRQVLGWLARGCEAELRAVDCSRHRVTGQQAECMRRLSLAAADCAGNLLRTAFVGTPTYRRLRLLQGVLLAACLSPAAAGGWVKTEEGTKPLTRDVWWRDMAAWLQTTCDLPAADLAFTTAGREAVWVLWRALTVPPVDRTVALQEVQRLHVWGELLHNEYCPELYQALGAFDVVSVLADRLREVLVLSLLPLPPVAAASVLGFTALREGVAAEDAVVSMVAVGHSPSGMLPGATRALVPALSAKETANNFQARVNNYDVAWFAAREATVLWPPAAAAQDTGRRSLEEVQRFVLDRGMDTFEQELRGELVFPQFPWHAHFPTTVQTQSFFQCTAWGKAWECMEIGELAQEKEVAQPGHAGCLLWCAAAWVLRQLPDTLHMAIVGGESAVAQEALDRVFGVSVCAVEESV